MKDYNRTSCSLLVSYDLSLSLSLSLDSVLEEKQQQKVDYITIEAKNEQW